jgi:ArsR family transcriptional regulator
LCVSHIDVCRYDKLASYIDACQYVLMEPCCTPITSSLGQEEAAELADLLKVLADPARLRILSLLTSSDEVCACDLTGPLDLSQPTVSHHMKVLRNAGFIESERRGKWVYHRLAPSRLDEIRAALEVPGGLTPV